MKEFETWFFRCVATTVYDRDLREFGLLHLGDSSSLARHGRTKSHSDTCRPFGSIRF
jgi:hypothetical protein